VAAAVLVVVLSAGSARSANDRTLSIPYELTVTERGVMVGMDSARRLCRDEPSCRGLSPTTLQSYQWSNEWLPSVDGHVPSDAGKVGR
jgi:hypothetical protein